MKLIFIEKERKNQKSKEFRGLEIQVPSYQSNPSVFATSYNSIVVELIIIRHFLLTSHEMRYFPQDFPTTYAHSYDSGVDLVSSAVMVGNFHKSMVDVTSYV